MMSMKSKLITIILISIDITLAAAILLHSKNIAVLNPQGIIASKERELFIIGILLSCIVVIPVYILTIAIIFKYHEDNTKATYTPDWDHQRSLEFIWWGIPSAIILILSVITWISSHDLDPYKSLASTTKPMTIQVVALDWKWLFIYPGQDIATVNLVEFPEKTPIDFEITSDTVMNSFWIPNLGGQIYAMPGMSTQLHLMADTTGSFPGSSANISGKGFSGMTFTAKAVSQSDFVAWLQKVKQSPNTLTTNSYAQLAKPSTNVPVSVYSHEQSSLYDTIVMKYMTPTQPNPSLTMPSMKGGSME